MRLTEPQRRALEALHDADQRGIEALVSNNTTVHEFGVCVYWQTADKLIDKGLAEQPVSLRGSSPFAIQITEAGRVEMRGAK